MPLTSPSPISQHGTVPASVRHDLQQAKFVFIHCDTHRTPHQYSYEGPYTVPQPGLKTFKIDRGGRSEMIAVDRLKPTHADLEHSIQPSVPQSQGRPERTPILHLQVRPNNTT